MRKRIARQQTAGCSARISEHITNIYQQGELMQSATVRIFRTVRKEGNRTVTQRAGGASVTATYLTFVETCKLMAKTPLDFFRGFFDMIVAGRRDYALMTEALLVKPV